MPNFAPLVKAGAKGVDALVDALRAYKGPSVSVSDDAKGLAKILREGNEVGFIKYDPKEFVVQINKSEILPEFRGQGVGTEAYKQFINDKLNQGLAVHSDSDMTASARRVWESLQKQGYEVEKNPFTRYMRGADDRLTTTDRNFRLLNQTSQGFDPLYKISGY